jgi:hypothetical protein
MSGALSFIENLIDAWVFNWVLKNATLRTRDESENDN